MKPWKIIIPLALLIGVSAGAYIGISKSNEQKLQDEIVASGEGELFNFDSSSINEFSLTDSGETFNLVCDDNSNWSFTDKNVKVNNSNIIYAINTLSALSTSKRVEENAQDLSKYGLDNPITISCGDGSNTYSVEVGNTSPTGESYYIKLPDNNDVYTISADDGVTLHLTKNDLKFKYIIDAYVSIVNKIVYKKGDETIFNCQKTDGSTWSLIEPTTSLTVNLSSISNIADLLIRADVVDFISENPTQDELKSYGLDNPLYTIEIADDDEDRTVYFGNSPEDNIIYAQFSDTKEVVTFNISELGIIDAGLEAILNKTVYTDEKQYISNVSISYNGTTTNIDVSYNKDERLFSYSKNGTPVTNDDQILKVSSIVDSTTNIPLYSVDFSAQPTGEPTLTISYTRTTEPTNLTLKFIPTDENASYYYILVNDQYQGAIVRDRYLRSEGGIIYTLENQ